MCSTLLTGFPPLDSELRRLSRNSRSSSSTFLHWFASGCFVCNEEFVILTLCGSWVVIERLAFSWRDSQLGGRLDIDGRVGADFWASSSLNATINLWFTCFSKIVSIFVSIKKIKVPHLLLGQPLLFRYIDPLFQVRLCRLRTSQESDTITKCEKNSSLWWTALTYMRHLPCKRFCFKLLLSETWSKFSGGRWFNFTYLSVKWDCCQTSLQGVQVKTKELLNQEAIFV